MNHEAKKSFNQFYGHPLDKLVFPRLIERSSCNWLAEHKKLKRIRSTVPVKNSTIFSSLDCE